jgi:type I restriction enzyme R subunit
MNLRKALPNASFIGFTGTPLFKDDELTRRIFGEYVSKYDFKRSIEDGATVPLYYENRGEKLRLDNPIINDQIREAIEQEDLDNDQQDKLKKLFSREYPILTAEKRLRAIAKDVVSHFNGRGYKGKAIFVAMDKVMAVKMFDLITEEWAIYLETSKKEIDKIDDLQEQLSQQRDWEWSKETEISVIVSHEQNEIDKFEAWGLDIEQHRLKMNTRDLEKEFKEENNPFRIAIVCAMWITGFDVKSLSTLYLDKPMKSHTLMQTIARANRVHEGKNNGLIVDYIETYKALLEALAIYGDSDNKGKGKDGADDVPVRPLEELVADLAETIQATDLFLDDECSFKLVSIINADDNLYRIKFIQEGYNALCKNDESRNKFGILAREVFKKYKALMPDNAIYEFKDKRDAINALYSLMTDIIDEADITHVVSRVQYVVNQSIESLNMVLEQAEGYGQKIDLSGLDFKKIEEEFLKVGGNKNIAVQSLRDRVAKKMNRLLDQNPMRIDFYERYQEIIENYNNGKEYATVKELFDALILLLGDLSEEEKRAERENLNDDELTVFDMLNSGKKMNDKERVEVKDTARKLLEQLKNNEFKVELWAEKTQTASAVKKSINDYLYTKLPFPTYSDGDRVVKTEILFNYFKTRYANYGRVA